MGQQLVKQLEDGRKQAVFTIEEVWSKNPDVLQRSEDGSDL